MKNILLAFSIVILFGCNEKVYDVSYYSENLDKAKEMEVKCKVGDVSGDNCKNAQEALNNSESKAYAKGFFRRN